MKYLGCWTESDFTGSVRLKKMISANSPEEAKEKIKLHIKKYLESTSNGSSASAGYIEISSAPELLHLDKKFYDKKDLPEVNLK
jgi:hypothetical protein